MKKYGGFLEFSFRWHLLWTFGQRKFTISASLGSKAVHFVEIGSSKLCVFEICSSLFFLFLFVKVLCFWERKCFSYKVVAQKKKKKYLALENVLHDVTSLMKKYVNLVDFLEINQTRSMQSYSNSACDWGLHVCRYSKITVSSVLFISWVKKMKLLDSWCCKLLILKINACAGRICRHIKLLIKRSI